MSKENAKNFFIGKIDKAIEKSNHELHIELIEKHINFTKTSDGLNSSIRCFFEHGRASGTFLQQLKIYAEEYKDYFVEPINDKEIDSGIVQEKKSLKDSLCFFLRNEHDLILLDSEVFKIIHLIDKFRSENES
jgi:hypothetical protein